MQAPVAVINATTKREHGKKAQFGNIMAGKVSWLACLFLCDSTMLILMQAVADIIRTTLGPRAMLKMLLDASGGALRCHARSTYTTS